MKSLAVNQVKRGAENKTCTYWWGVSLTSVRGRELRPCPAFLFSVHHRLISTGICARLKLVGVSWGVCMGPCVQSTKSVEAEATQLVVLPGSNSLVARSLVLAAENITTELSRQVLNVQGLWTATKSNVEHLDKSLMLNLLVPLASQQFSCQCVWVLCKHFKPELEPVDTSGITGQSYTKPRGSMRGHQLSALWACQTVQEEIQGASEQKSSAERRVKIPHCCALPYSFWRLCFSGVMGNELLEASASTRQLSFSADPFAGWSAFH